MPVTDDEAKRSSEELVAETKKRGRKGIRLHDGGPRAQQVLVDWMYGFVQRNSLNGICGASRIEALRQLADGRASGFRLQKLREGLTGCLEEGGWSRVSILAGFGCS